MKLMFPMKERKQIIQGSNKSKENAHSTSHDIKEKMSVYMGSRETVFSGGKEVRKGKKNAQRRKMRAHGCR